MSIDQPARFSIITGAGQWQRCAFGDPAAGFLQAALVDGAVQLPWEAAAAAGPFGKVADAAGAGLAFDGHCRLFHSLPAEGRVERLLLHRYDPARPHTLPPAADLLTAGAPPAGGEFRAAADASPGFAPRALASDGGDHLFMLDTAARCVRVFDLRGRRLLRSQPAPPGAVDLAWHGGRLWLLAQAPAALWRMTVARPLRPVAADLGGLSRPDRLAVHANGRFFVLDCAHHAAAAIYEIGRPGAWQRPQPIQPPAAGNPFAHASDIECISDCAGPALIVARRPDEPFQRVDLAAAPYPLAPPLAARRYDGLGIAAAPDGRVLYWSSAGGPRYATAARLDYRSPARVVGFRLDSGSYRTVWGRVLLEACLPQGSAIGVHCLVGDDEEAGERVARTPPAGTTLAPIAEEAATPLPLRALMPGPDSPPQALFRRPDGPEQAWLGEEAGFATFETPAPTTPGRYLWLIFDLHGSSRATPRLLSARVERPGHDWLRRLPGLYAREAAMRDFLQRYLAPLAGLEQQLAEQSEGRHALLKPCSAPAATLPWLAGWLGLGLDERFPERVQRAFIREAAALFRLRGTLWSLRRMVEIAAEAPVVIVEKFRMRGFGRAGGRAGAPTALLGAGFRVGGPSDAEGSADTFAPFAHRFSVVVLADLDAERAAAIRHLLEQHRPAHTLFELCSAGAGMRVGRGLQVGMTAVIGPGSGFTPLQLGASSLGREGLLGAPRDGVKAGSARLGRDSRIG